MADRAHRGGGGGVDALGVLWGKSEERAGGTMNLLVSHLLDTAAVAERMWDGFLAPSGRRMLDGLAGGPGRGRALFAWLCGVHDCGKATPSHQRLWPKGADAVRAAGLGWDEPTLVRTWWRHDRAGAFVLREVLGAAGWRKEHIAWVWPLVAGHHGSYPSFQATLQPRKAMKQAAGGPAWAEAQASVVEWLTHRLGFGRIAEVEPTRVPSRAEQMQISGLIVMADWIASNEKYFEGIDALAKVTPEKARERAEGAWEALRLRGGWGRLPEPGPEAFQDRFGHGPRPSQTLVMDAARRMPAPGILVVEAPMGEGKTKAALMAAEILAARFGADGVFVGMPTQSTSDPMFAQVRSWVGRVDEELPAQVALLHGKRMFNREWRALVEESGDDPDDGFGGVDEYGECLDEFGTDEYGMASPEPSGAGPRTGSRGPSEWFLGAKRGLLCPFVVGTIDQLLFAATRSKHVMLRMAGLIGKVVVLDEVHAADVYMSQFLKEALRWLGQAGVPVVLLSATLPPHQRRELVDAYLSGAASREEFETGDGLPEPPGYPSVTTACLSPDDARPVLESVACDGWRADLTVALELLPEAVPAPTAGKEAAAAAQQAADREIAARLGTALAEGGCALVIRNTVGRAQSLHTVLCQEFDADEVLLLHGRIAVAPKADRVEQCLRRLGPPAPTGGVQEQRPRLIVVATQIAEQSFDVDADVLVTDLAPVDLLLQRVGRLHRHDGVVRPPRLARPRVLITGLGDRAGAPAPDMWQRDDADPPRFLRASEFIYRRHQLLRTAALVRAALVGGTGAWMVPSQVPGLVASGYGTDDTVMPPQWRKEAEEARRSWDAGESERARKAAGYLLTRLGEKEGTTLAGLHSGSATGGRAGLDALVRDGDATTEVVLVRHSRGTYRTLSGRALTANGDVADDLLDDVLGGTVRLPASLTEDARRELRPLPGWSGHPRLRYSPALVLDERGSATLGDRALRYDQVLGLVMGDGPP
ncbi:CRISPR-associated helicase Cas3' [Streptomyces uncialis]|uniref:CRISPR-associated helicase Cas3' n=1 Tax=Streptomyces uncialis TaxID=1048205 RepID=UPI0036570577